MCVYSLPGADSLPLGARRSWICARYCVCGVLEIGAMVGMLTLIAQQLLSFIESLPVRVLPPLLHAPTIQLVILRPNDTPTIFDRCVNLNQVHSAKVSL